MSSDPSEGKAAPSVGSAVLDQAFDGDSLYALRAPVAAHAAEAGLSWQRVYDVAAAAHELAANAVRHGAGHGRLRLWADCSSLHCQVSDDGPAEQDETRPDPAAWQREHAHGLWIIDQVADTVTLDHDPCGATVTATFTGSSFGWPRGTRVSAAPPPVLRTVPEKVAHSVRAPPVGVVRVLTLAAPRSGVPRPTTRCRWPRG